GVAGGQLMLIRVEEFEVLFQDEEVLWPIVSCESGGDFGLGRLTAAITVLGEVFWVPAAGDDVAEDAQSGDAGDVTDDQVELEIHLHERLLHALGYAWPPSARGSRGGV